LVALELEQSTLALPRPGGLDQGEPLAPQFVVRGPRPAIVIEAFTQTTEGIEQRALAVRVEQGPALVLAVDIDELLTQPLARADRHRQTVALSGAPSRGRDPPGQDQAVFFHRAAENGLKLRPQRGVANLKDRRRAGLGLARANQLG